MPVSVPGVGAEREAVTPQVHHAEGGRQGPAHARVVGGAEEARPAGREQRAGQGAGVQAEAGGDLRDAERGAEGLLVGDRERVGGPGAVPGQVVARRAGVAGRCGQALDGPADRVAAVPFAGAEQHGEIDPVRAADGVVDAGRQQVGEARGDAHAEDRRRSRRGRLAVQGAHLVEESACGADVDDVDAASEAEPRDPGVRRLDSQHDHGHVPEVSSTRPKPATSVTSTRTSPHRPACTTRTGNQLLSVAVTVAPTAP